MKRFSSTFGIIASCAIIFGLCILLETVRWSREHFFAAKEVEQSSNKAVLHFIDCMLYFIQLSISYLLMLVVMTLNAWLSLAVVLGQFRGLEVVYVANLEDRAAANIDAFFDGLIARNMEDKSSDGDAATHHQHHAVFTSEHGEKHSAASHGDIHMSMGMSMWFHGGYDETILFQFWKITSLQGLLLSCAALFIVGILYEGVKWLRLHTNVVDGGARSRSNTWDAASQQLRDFILYALQLFLSYALMLVVMTYNVWLSISVILGLATGNFLCSKFTGSGKRELDTADACH